MFIRIHFWRILIIPIFLTICLFLVFLRLGDYRLNRTIRETDLRLTLLSHMSRIRRLDFRVMFQERSLVVDVFDKERGAWKRDLEWPYEKGVKCNTIGWQYVFSRGSFIEYQSNDWIGKVPRYIIVSFQYESSLKEKKIIFYRDGTWRVMG